MVKRKLNRFSEDYFLLYHLYRIKLIPKSDLALYRGQVRDRYAQKILRDHIEAGRIRTLRYNSCNYCCVTAKGLQYLTNQESHTKRQATPIMQEYADYLDQTTTQADGNAATPYARHTLSGAAKKEGQREAGEAVSHRNDWMMWEPWYREPTSQDRRRTASILSLSEKPRPKRLRSIVRRGGAENLLYSAGVVVYAEDKPSYGQLLQCLKSPNYKSSFIWRLISTHGIYYHRTEMHREPGVAGYSNRMIGVLFTQNGVYVIYNTLARFSKWFPSTESEAVARIRAELLGTAPYHERPLNGIICAVGKSMVSSIVSGHMYGRNRTKTIPGTFQRQTMGKWMTGAELRNLFESAYLIELNGCGLNSLCQLITDQEGTHGRELEALARSNPRTFQLVSATNGQHILMEQGTGRTILLMKALDLMELYRIRSSRQSVICIAPERMADQVSKSLGTRLHRYISIETWKSTPVTAYDDDGNPQKT